MPRHSRPRLRRVLAGEEVRPLGGDKPIKVDIRVIAASHRDIRQMIEAGQFREDLYYRLNGATLKLPALRERADKGYLIERLFIELSEQRQRPPRLRGDAMSALLGYAWPGNIRELRNALQYALATCEGEEITVDDLPEQCLPSPGPRLLAPAEQARTLSADPAAQLEATLRRHRWNVSAAARELSLSRPTIYRWMKVYNIVPPKAWE